MTSLWSLFLHITSLGMILIRRCQLLMTCRTGTENWNFICNSNPKNKWIELTIGWDYLRNHFIISHLNMLSFHLFSQELQELHSALEEAKADIVGLWALRFLIDQVRNCLSPWSCHLSVIRRFFFLNIKNILVIWFFFFV